MEAQIFNWMMDVFFIFALHILCRKALGIRFENKWVLALGWCGYFVTWNACSYLLGENPLINGICSLIINFIFMCLLYTGSVRSKIVLVFMIVVLGFVSETVVGFIYGLLDIRINQEKPKADDFFFIANAMSKVLMYIFMKIITIMSVKKNNIQIKLTDWIEVFLVPIGTIIIFYIVERNAKSGIDVSEIIIFGLLLIINISTYYIYQKIQSQAERMVAVELLEQQNRYYSARHVETEEQWAVLKAIRHDMRNSYILEKAYLENGQYDELNELYEKAIGSLKGKSNIINTGNIGVDAIINYKYEVARKSDIVVEQKIKVLGKIRIDNGELNALIGNLFDNAIEAAEKVQGQKRKIVYKLYSDETAMLFEICNYFSGELSRNKRGEIVTIKEEKEEHGLGLNTVRAIANRHNGTVDIKVGKSFFDIKVFLSMD